MDVNTSTLNGDLAEIETLLQLSSRSTVRGWLTQLHADLSKVRFRVRGHKALSDVC